MPGAKDDGSMRVAVVPVFRNECADGAGLDGDEYRFGEIAVREDVTDILQVEVVIECSGIFGMECTRRDLGSHFVAVFSNV